MYAIKYQIDHEAKIARETLCSLKDIKTIIDNLSKFVSTPITKDDEPMTIFL